MSQGYRLNGGVVGFLHNWTSTKTGVWDVKSPYLNNNLGLAVGEVQFTTVGSHSWTVPDGVTSVSVLTIGGGGGGMYYGVSSSGYSYRMN